MPDPNTEPVAKTDEHDWATKLILDLACEEFSKGRRLGTGDFGESVFDFAMDQLGADSLDVVELEVDLQNRLEEMGFSLPNDWIEEHVDFEADHGITFANVRDYLLANFDPDNKSSPG